MPQQLKEQIQKHVPKFIRNKIKPQKGLPRRQCKSTQNAPVSNSAVSQHLLDNKICAKKFDINCFSKLATGRSYFHLATLEAISSSFLNHFFVVRKSSSMDNSFLACSASECETNRLFAFSNRSKGPLLSMSSNTL